MDKMLGFETRNNCDDDDNDVEQKKTSITSCELNLHFS